MRASFILRPASDSEALLSSFYILNAERPERGLRVGNGARAEAEGKMVR